MKINYDKMDLGPIYLVLRRVRGLDKDLGCTIIARSSPNLVDLRLVYSELQLTSQRFRLIKIKVNFKLKYGKNVLLFLFFKC